MEHSHERVCRLLLVVSLVVLNAVEAFQCCECGVLHGQQRNHELRVVGAVVVGEEVLEQCDLARAEGQSKQLLGTVSSNHEITERPEGHLVHVLVLLHSAVILGRLALLQSPALRPDDSAQCLSLMTLVYLRNDKPANAFMMLQQVEASQDDSTVQEDKHMYEVAFRTFCDLMIR